MSYGVMNGAIAKDIKQGAGGKQYSAATAAVGAAAAPYVKTLPPNSMYLTSHKDCLEIAFTEAKSVVLINGFKPDEQKWSPEINRYALQNKITYLADSLSEYMRRNPATKDGKEHQAWEKLRNIFKHIDQGVPTQTILKFSKELNGIIYQTFTQMLRVRGGNQMAIDESQVNDFTSAIDFSHSKLDSLHDLLLSYSAVLKQEEHKPNDEEFYLRIKQQIIPLVNVFSQPILKETNAEQHAELYDFAQLAALRDLLKECGNFYTRDRQNRFERASKPLAFAGSVSWQAVINFLAIAKKTICDKVGHEKPDALTPEDIATACALAKEVNGRECADPRNINLSFSSQKIISVVASPPPVSVSAAVVVSKEIDPKDQKHAANAKQATVSVPMVNAANVSSVSVAKAVPSVASAVAAAPPAPADHKFEIEKFNVDSIMQSLSKISATDTDHVVLYQQATDLLDKFVAEMQSHVQLNKDEKSKQLEEWMINNKELLANKYKAWGGFRDVMTKILRQRIRSANFDYVYDVAVLNNLRAVKISIMKLPKLGSENSTLDAKITPAIIPAAPIFSAAAKQNKKPTVLTAKKVTGKLDLSPDSKNDLGNIYQRAQDFFMSFEMEMQCYIPSGDAKVDAKKSKPDKPISEWYEHTMRRLKGNDGIPWPGFIWVINKLSQQIIEVNVNNGRKKSEKITEIVIVISQITEIVSGLAKRAAQSATAAALRPS